MNILIKKQYIETRNCWHKGCILFLADKLLHSFVICLKRTIWEKNVLWNQIEYRKDIVSGKFNGW